MNTKDILLNESGIRIPKNAKAAKIIHHQDLDGVFSAIVTYNQLVKQGIKPQNIKIDGIQYGSDEKMKGLLKRQKGQMIAVVDFARMPSDLKPGEFPDFWSDHHEPPEGMVRGKGEKGPQMGKAGARVGATEFKSDTEHIATLHTNNMVDGATLKAITTVDSAAYKNVKDTFLIRKDFKEKNRMERLAILVNAIMSETGLWNNSTVLEGFIKKVKPSLVSVYNTLLDTARLNTIQKQGITELGKDNPDWALVEKIRASMPDKRSREAVVSPKSKMKSRVKELALTKEQRAEKLEQRKADEAEKAAKRAEKYKKNEDIDEGAFEDREELLKLRAKEDKTSDEKARIKELSDPVPRIRERRESSLKKHTKPYKDKEKSKFERKGVVTYAPAKTQRYLWSLLQKEGIKSPFVIKKFGSMIQVAINPDIPDEVKKNIDLNKMRLAVMAEVKKEVNDKYQDWAFDIIEKDSGGHKGITNITGLHLINLAPKKVREELKYIKSFEDRIKALKGYGYRKLTGDDKEKFHKAAAIVKSVESKDPLTDEDRDLFKRLKLELNKIMKNEPVNGSVLDEYDKWVKANLKDLPMKGDPFKDKETLQLKKKMRTLSKVKPKEEEMYKDALKVRNMLMPTLERLFPAKAKRKEELTVTTGKYKTQADKIKQSIVDKFEKRLKELSDKYKIELKGDDPQFEVKGEKPKSQMSDEELDKKAAEGRRGFKKLSLKEKQEIIAKKKKEDANLSKEERELKDEQNNYIRKGYSNSEALKLAKEKIERNKKGMAAAIKARSK